MLGHWAKASMSRKSQRRRWIIGLCLVVVSLGAVAAIGGGWLLFFDDSPLNKASAIDATEEWARLAPLPLTKTDLVIQTSGSAFTRQFDVSFRDTPANIRAWLSACPGPTSISPTIDDSGWSIYRYEGGGGALAGEVRVSPLLDEVHIIATWS